MLGLDVWASFTLEIVRSRLLCGLTLWTSHAVKCIFTVFIARRYAERGIAMSSRLSVRQSVRDVAQGIHVCLIVLASVSCCPLLFCDFFSVNLYLVLSASCSSNFTNRSSKVAIDCLIIIISAKWTEWNWRIYCFHFCVRVCLKPGSH